MPRTVTLSCRSFNDLQNKVKAIKGARALSSLGLREAKDLVERVNPGHSEVIKVGHDVLEPRYSEALQLLKDSGLTVLTNNTNEKVRNAIGDEIRSLITYSTMAAQYDIAKALLDLMETYCPEPSEKLSEKDDVR